MVERETSRYIDEVAADWIARLDRGPLSKDEQAAFDQWQSGDPRRRGALMRANAMAMLSQSAQALGPQFDPAQFAAAPPPRGVSRRKWLGWAGAGGAVAAAVAVLGITAPSAGAITTGLGEVRLVTLDDGSTVMLNTRSSIRVRYGQSERRIELLYGEAYFSVVDDPRRPFRVDIAPARMEAARGGFRVRKLDDMPVDILVNQGDLALEAPGAARLVMSANTRISLPLSQPPAAGFVPQTVSPDFVSRELAWREGKLAFEGERLDRAAAEFARYSRTRIEIADPQLAAEPITGLFAASNPVGFGRAIATLFGAHVEVRPEVVILSRRPAGG